nr:L-serine ammonia-lyase, iron-sulfur-dependent, subunit alpha [Tissierella sp.]
MSNKIKYNEKLLQSLVDGVKPALGCTEPVAVGLAAAKAYEGVKGEVKSIKVMVSPNIYKNGMGVGIPGTEEVGLVFAAALGVTCGDASLNLQVFRNVDEDTKLEARDLLNRDLVEVILEDKKGNFFIEAQVETDQGKGTCRIKNSHTNIVYVEAAGEVLLDIDTNGKVISNKNDYLKEVTLKDIKNFVETVEFSDISFLLEGVKVNMDIAQVGLDEKSGPGIGAAMNILMDEGVMQKDVINQARVLTSAACDARMSGINMPVMSSAGSGNQGITAIIPPAVMCEHIGCDDEKLARSLAFSHLTTAYIKIFTGNLSPVCACAIAAGIGASASIVWMLEGSLEQIGTAIKNMVGTLTGMVCDGAKGGCSFKLSTASSEAIIQAKLAMAGIVIGDYDGITNPDADTTIKNLGKFCNEGMKSADEEIINIMLTH